MIVYSVSFGEHRELENVDHHRLGAAAAAGRGGMGVRALNR